MRSNIKLNPWDRHDIELNAIVTTATAHLRRWATQNPNATVEQTKGVVRELVRLYGSLAATSAVRAIKNSRQTYDQWRELPPPEKAPAFFAGQCIRAVAWALQTKNPDKPSDPVSNMARLDGILGRLVRQGSRYTIYEATRIAGTRWARIPGPKACWFCLMLASRGAVYNSPEAASVASGTRGPQKAGLKFHDFCNCRIVESYSDADLPEFIHELNDEWHEATKGIHRGNSEALREAWRTYVKATRPEGETIRPDSPVTPIPDSLGAKRNFDHPSRVPRDKPTGWDFPPPSPQELVLNRQIAPSENPALYAVTQAERDFVLNCPDPELAGRLLTIQTPDRAKDVGNTDGMKTPDYIDRDYVNTFDYKLVGPTTQDRTIVQAIRHGRGQSPNLLIDLRQKEKLPDLEQMKKEIWRYRKGLLSIRLYLPNGEMVKWEYDGTE